jgi:hypothetical protein
VTAASNFNEFGSATSSSSHRRTSGFTHGVSQRFEIVTTGCKIGSVKFQRNKFPTSRCSQSRCMHLAQVIGVGLGISSQRTYDCRAFGIDVRQGGYGGSIAH